MKKFCFRTEGAFYLSPQAWRLLAICLSLHLLFDLSLPILFHAGIISLDRFVIHMTDTWESQWAALSIAVGGTLLFDYEIKRQCFKNS